MARRRRVFRQRVSFTRRLARGAAVAFAALAAVITIAYLTLPQTAGLALRVALRQHGWGPVALHIDRLGFRGAVISNVSLADGAVIVRRLAFDYSPLDLLRHQIRAVTVIGAQATFAWTDTGLRLGPHRVTLPPAGTRPRLPRRWRVMRVTVADGVVAVPVGRAMIAAGLGADLAADDGRWDGSINLAVRVPSRAAEPLLTAAWQGTLAPRDLARWTSRGSLDAPARDWEVADGIRLSAGGHLDLATGDGNFALTGPAPLVLTVPAVPEAALAELAKPLQDFARTGLVLAVSGSSGGPRLTIHDEAQVRRSTLDAALSVSLGEGRLQAMARGALTGSVASQPDTIALEAARLQTESWPLSVGKLTGFAQIGPVNGPLATAAGPFTTEFAVAGLKAGAARAATVTLASGGTFALNALTLQFTPAKFALDLDRLQIAGIAFAGRNRLGLSAGAGSAAAPALTLAFGPARIPKLAFDLPLAFQTLAVAGASEPGAQLDLPHIALKGSISDAQYEIGVAAPEGSLSHPLADLHLRALQAEIRPGSLHASGEASLSRFIARPARGQQVTPGLSLSATLTGVGQHAVLDVPLRNSGGQSLGTAQAHFDLAAGTGEATVNVPALAFGPGGLPPRDILSSATSVTGLSGTLALSAHTAWNADGVTSAGQVTAKDFGLQMADVSLTGANGTVALAGLWPPTTAAPQQITIAEADLGIPVKAASVAFSLPGNGRISLDRVAGEVLGGRVEASGTIPAAEGGDGLLVKLKSLDLSAIASQAQLPGLTAAGRLSGAITLHSVDHGWRISDGKLRNDGPGHIAYRPTEPPPVLASGGAQTLLRALSNFDYKILTATLSGTLPAAVSAGLYVRGANADISTSSPTTFTLSFRGPWGQVLRQGLVGYRIVSERDPATP